METAAFCSHKLGWGAWTVQKEATMCEMAQRVQRRGLQTLVYIKMTGAT